MRSLAMKLLAMMPLTTWAFVLAASCFTVSPAHAETVHETLNRDAVSKVIGPLYGAFAAKTDALKTKVDALCTQHSEAALEEARDAFAETVKRWSWVEIFQFGPVNQENRYERLFFWPDRKGRGLRQVQRALMQKDETVTSRGTLAQKSVALQGLPALEYLIYGKGADVLAGTDEIGAFRCRFASAVAANIAAIAEEVERAWGKDEPFTKMFLAPGPNDPLYRSPKDATLELFKTFSGGIERVRDLKLGRPLGESPIRARPRLAAFWLSDLAFPNMAGNLKGVRALFIDGGFEALVAAQSPGVEKSVLFDLDRVTEGLEAEQEPIAEAVIEPEQREKLEAYRVGLKSARDTASELIAEGAGLSFGFNALDGD